MHQLRDQLMSAWHGLKDLCFYIWGYTSGGFSVFSAALSNNADLIDWLISTTQGVLGVAVVFTTLILNIRKIRKK